MMLPTTTAQVKLDVMRVCKELANLMVNSYIVKFAKKISALTVWMPIIIIDKV